MFLAMNRFKIAKGFEADFEKIWAERESFLTGVPGFTSFVLLKGDVFEDHTVYASHSVWASHSAFEAWTQSEHFRNAHAQAKAPAGTYIGPPQLELFDAVQDVLQG